MGKEGLESEGKKEFAISFAKLLHQTFTPTFLGNSVHIKDGFSMFFSHFDRESLKNSDFEKRKV